MAQRHAGEETAVGEASEASESSSKWVLLNWRPDSQLKFWHEGPRIWRSKRHYPYHCEVHLRGMILSPLLH